MKIAAFLIVVAACQAQSVTPREYLEAIAREQLAARKQRIAAVATREQFEQRRTEVRRHLLAMLGGLPEARSPLNLRTAGVLRRSGYRVEKIIYESLPRFYVTANLYVPEGGKPPYPAVLQPTGHSLAAKARAFYQTLSLGLVKNGFVVLTYDPVGQGERRIFYDAALGDSKVGGTTTEHQMAGIQSLLGGESIARYMVNDGMRSIDVLQSLPYVDAKRIGVSGCSGGGTLTAYLAALDSRVQAAAPTCYITDWEDQLPGTGPQDAEQQFPDQLRNGLNHADLVEAFAPKPYLIGSTTEDFFPIAGARKTFEESRRIYELFGAGDRIAASIEPGGHGTPQRQREAVYAWMRRWLANGSGELLPEPEFVTEYEEDLLCTPTGQVGGETPSTLNMQRLSKLTPARPAEVRDDVVRLTRYQASSAPLKIQTFEQTPRKGYRLTRLRYETAPGRVVSAMLAEPERTRRKSVLYVDERPATAAGGDVEQLAQLGYTVLAIDAFGMGESAPAGASINTQWFEHDKLTWLALMVGKTMVGLRMEDILRGVDVLRERGLLDSGECIGFAKGAATVALLHAAVLDPRIGALAVEGGLVSYAAIARTPIHRRVFDAVIPGVLGKYDLPDLVAALAPRPVWLVNLKSPLGTPLFLRDARSEYSHSKTAQIGLRREEEPVAGAYPALR